MFALLVAVPTLALQSQSPELVSPLGRRLYAQRDTAGVVARAESAVARAPENGDSLVALGQALASVWRYGDAIAVYSRALRLAPTRAVLYRHRGHRYISTRQFDKAIADLERAAALDTTSFDIWYHLGLAYYLVGRFDDAARAYRRCLGTARDADDSVAVSDWLWSALARARRRAEAAAVLTPIGEGMAVRENGAYYHRLLFYKGLRTEQELHGLMGGGELEHATVGYGLANWHLVQGDSARARVLFEAITAGGYWPAFGFIAAEAELGRLR